MVIDVSFVKRHIKPKADSTLLNMKKSDLIEYVRILEHNYNVAVSFNEQQARNIETMIKNGDIPSKWISVEDRLPEPTQNPVLAFYRGMANTAWCHGELWEFLPRCMTKGVTHWMPLPEPPKED